MTIVKAIRSAVKNFNAKEKTIDRQTGTVDATRLASFTEQSSRSGKRGYVKNGHQLSTHAYSRHAGLLNYLKTRGDKKEHVVGTVDRLNREQLAFINTVKSVAQAGRALNDPQLEASAKFILNGDWESTDSYRITPELAAHVRYIADALVNAQTDAILAKKPLPEMPRVDLI